jgi:hypothetical protein
MVTRARAGGPDLNEMSNRREPPPGLSVGVLAMTTAWQQKQTGSPYPRDTGFFFPERSFASGAPAGAG